MFNLTPWSHKRVPVRREEEQPIYTLQREMNKLFEDVFKSSSFDRFTDFPAFPAEMFSGELTPRIDMVETDKEVVVKVELPGMTEKDFDISVNKDVLTISGEKKQEKEETEKGWYRMERQYGSFSRSIPLPYETEYDKAEAEYKSGILSIKLPKSAVQQKATKTIPVKKV